jgi:hypothetical protein
MKLILVISAFLLSLQCFASTKAFDVKAEVSIDGKLVSRPHIVTKPNELASINQKLQGDKDILIEMTASDYHSKDPKNGIMMKFTVSRLDEGKRTVLATPQIVALPGEEAMIEIGKAKAETVKVKVLATRVQ